MARRAPPCDALVTVTALLLVAGAAVVVVADDDSEKCGNPCGNPCGVPCIYASPPPPEPEYYPPPPPVYSPPPPEYYPPPPPEYYPPAYPDDARLLATAVGGGGYNPAPYTPGGGGGGYNPTPSGGWYTPPYLPSYNTPPGTLYPQDPGFKPNGAPGSGAAWRAVAAVVAASAVAGALAL